MFRLNLKIAWRNLWKNKSYTLINILGLSVGMAGCMLLYLFICYQLGFDNGYKNEDRIYRFVTNWRYPSYNDYSKGIPLPLAAAAKNELSKIEKGAVIINRGGVIHVSDATGKEIYKNHEPFYYAEPEFFEIFEREWIHGHPQQSLSQPNSVALSEHMAIKIFGSASKAIGKSLRIGSNLQLNISGVFKEGPQNSSFPLDIVVSYRTFNSKKFIYWDGVNSAMEFYVMLNKNSTLNDMEGPVAAFNKRHYQDANIPGNQNNSLQPLKDIHFNQRYGSFANSTVSKKELYGLATIGVFLIFTACINFINLATAQAVNRSKEVGVRKVIGGKRSELFVQFLTETSVLTILSMIIAVVITEIAIPGLSSLVKIPPNFSYFNNISVYLFIAALILSISLLAGLYPAMIMSGFSPVLALKNKVTANAGGLGLRKILVVLQFSMTIILLIATLVITQQMKYLREKPLGFNSDAVAMINIPGDSLSQRKYNFFKEKAMQIPGVKMISFCQTAPSSDNTTSSEFTYKGKKNRDFEIRNAKADYNYFKLFDLQLVAGKSFAKGDELNRAVINETFLRKLGITDPQKIIGQVLNANGYDMLITGVVKDYNDLSLKENISPLIIYPQKEEYYAMAVKLEGVQIMQAMKKLERLWNSVFPADVYQSSFLKEDLNGYYESERLMGVLFRVAVSIVIFIALIGLFGLISFVAAQRSREVAIRKVLGASTMELVRLLNNSFLKMVLFANLVSWPFAYLFTSKWLQGFAYRIELSVWPFVGAFLISIIITLLTVTVKSYKTALANTTNALKYE